MDHLKKLRDRVAKVPRLPGVYRWLNEKGEVLYVGKAKDLRARMRAYVRKKFDKSAGLWKISLRERIRDFEFIVTQSELEALVLETNLIKELKPKYNVLMKDDKNYVYVHVTDEEYPRILTTRRIGVVPHGKYFGPFTSARYVEEMLRMLHDVFGFRACKNIGRDKPCLEYQIGRCNGLCVGKITKEEYCKRIEMVMRFLKGDRKDAVRLLRERMGEAAQQKSFERAARYRDLLERLKSQEEQVVSDTSRENLDAIGIAQSRGRFHVVLLKERNGRLVSELSFVLSGKAESPAQALEQFLKQYYRDAPDVPDHIVVGESLEDSSLLEEWLAREHMFRSSDSTIAAPRFSHSGYGRVRIHIPYRGKKLKLLHMAEFNAKEKIKHQFASFEREKEERKSALQELRDVLNLKKLPRRIEGYDISHLSGVETVGSMVVFQNGKSFPDGYRSFTIRSLKEGEIDDYKALREVLTRRLKYLLSEEYREEFDGKKKRPDESLNAKPDLLVIDGGKGQLSTAVDVLTQLVLHIPVIGLAKREEDVFVPGKPLPVPFNKDSPALLLLMHLRDEAHRRAHMHYEKRRAKRMVQ